MDHAEKKKIREVAERGYEIMKGGHALMEEMNAAIKARDAELTRLRSANAELAEAVEQSLNWLSSYPGGLSKKAYDKARAALAKHKGTTP